MLRIMSIFVPLVVSWIGIIIFIMRVWGAGEDLGTGDDAFNTKHQLFFPCKKKNRNIFFIVLLLFVHVLGTIGLYYFARRR